MWCRFGVGLLENSAFEAAELTVQLVLCMWTNRQDGPADCAAHLGRELDSE